MESVTQEMTNRQNSPVCQAVPRTTPARRSVQPCQSSVSSIRMKEYRDHYFLKAKRENYPARSVYKLKELDSKFRLLRPGQRVLDLGAAPGSWGTYTAIGSYCRFICGAAKIL
jgi:23S rRNA methylase